MQILTRTKEIALALLLALALVFSFASCTPLTPDPEILDTGHLEFFDYDAIPEYSGNEYATVNNNTPFFTEEEKVTYAYAMYGELDDFGRCTVAMAALNKSLMPSEDREDISSVYPTGWKQATYDCISGKYLYNRSHLIGFQLTGENALETNLITGTRYLNEAMIPFENMVAAYLKETNNHVMYRATPIFIGDNLLASGVLLEAYSVEDEGDGICFNVFLYNVQPGVTLNYATGASYESGKAPSVPDGSEGTESTSYVINKNNGKIHKSDCAYAIKMSEANKLTTSKSLDDLIAEGYTKAGCCLGN